MSELTFNTHLIYRVCHLAGEMVEMLKRQLDHEKERHSDIVPINEKDVLCVKIAGLCHDLGKIAELSLVCIIRHQHEAVFYSCLPKVMGPSPTFLMIGSFLQS